MKRDTYALSLFHTQTYTTHTHPHFLTPTHTLTQTLLREMPHPLCFINTLTHSLTVTNSHTISLTHPLSLSHSHTHTLTHTLSYTHTHSRTHTLLDEITPSFYSMNRFRTKKSMRVCLDWGRRERGVEGSSRWKCVWCVCEY